MEALSLRACVGCLTGYENTILHQYHPRSQYLQEIFQMNKVLLCYLCKRRVLQFEWFIQNVQSNQLLLANYHNINTASLQPQPIVTLTQHQLAIIELLETEEMEQNSFSVVYSSRDPIIKVEMKEEQHEYLVNHLEGEFLNAYDDFQETFVKTEADDGFNVNIEFKERKIKKPLKKKKRKAEKKPKLCPKSDTKLDSKVKTESFIERLIITREQCLEERALSACDDSYLDAVYKCERCVRGFNFLSTYKKHMEKHAPQRGEFECDICYQRMESENKFAIHLKNHTVRYRCTVCGLSRGLRRTILSHHAAAHAGAERHPCPHCHKVYTRRVALRKHMSYAHGRRGRALCRVCLKTFASDASLKMHMVIRHPSEMSGSEAVKRFPCGSCGRRLATRSQLRAHAATHCDVRAYYCVECDKNFKTDAVLKQHLKTARAHINYLDLPLSCAHCDKRFAIKRDVERHTNRVHLNVRPHACDLCDKAYLNTWSLQEHRRLAHEGYKRPRRFPCPLCDKVFDRNHILKSHVRTHTGERPYQCPKCPAAFGQAGVLGTHVKRVHLRRGKLDKQ